MACSTASPTVYGHRCPGQRLFCMFRNEKAAGQITPAPQVHPVLVGETPDQHSAEPILGFGITPHRRTTELLFVSASQKRVGLRSDGHGRAGIGSVRGAAIRPRTAPHHRRVVVHPTRSDSSSIKRARARAVRYRDRMELLVILSIRRARRTRTAASTDKGLLFGRDSRLRLTRSRDQNLWTRLQRLRLDRLGLFE